LKSSRAIRLYPNRRLYDPAVAGYIKYSDVLALVRDGFTVKVEDTVSGKDRTQKVFIDLVVLAEQGAGAGHQPLFTEGFLRDIICFSATEKAALVSAFLDHSMSMLAAAGKPR
jgi:polyhydroxyalkanoate synthesis repressor PhaR